MSYTGKRIICWFSCGATSAVAAKLVNDEYGKNNDVRIVYCDTGSEHPDNMRFLHDMEKFIGRKVEILKSAEYADIWDVFEKTRYLVGINGARCTSELKKKQRLAYQLPDDIHVFGFDSGEHKRVEQFRKNNHDIELLLPLVDRCLSKSDCLSLIEYSGIKLPEMYLLGYQNANCIGCVKGGAGYWNKIRKDFPDVFKRMSE